MKYWLFALLFLVVLLIVYGPAVSGAITENLASLKVVRAWARQSKDPGQIICQEFDQESLTAGAASALEIRDESQWTIINAARQAYYSGDCESAAAYWKLAAEKDSLDSADALLLFLSAGLDRELLPAEYSTSELAEYLGGLGLVSEKQHAQDQAQYWFNAAFELHPSRSIVSRLTPYQDTPIEEANLWRKLAETLPESDPSRWWALGREAELKEEWAVALQAYNSGASSADDPFDYLMKQGQVLMRLERLEEAESVFRVAVSLKPMRSQPYFQLGNLFSRKGDYETAKIWHELALDLAPDNFSQNYALGTTYYYLEDYDQAEERLRRALEISSRDSTALYFLAQTFYQTGREGEAQELLEQAINLDEAKRWNWLVILGDWRAGANDREGALRAYNKALQLRPNNAEISEKIEVLGRLQ
jgi:tetratricopeptide (TPR) repeat protein